MKIKVNLSREKRSELIEMRGDETLMDLVRKMEQPLDGVLIMSDGVPFPLDMKMEELPGTEISLVAVASGG